MGRSKMKTTNLKNIFVIGAIVFMTISNGYATENTTPLASDGRIKTVVYEKNNVVPVKGSTFISTQIIFGSNEKIIDIQGGDADAWTVNVSKMIPNVLNMKPTTLGSNTDIIVSTIDDQSKIRRYFLHLKSAKNNLDTKNQTYAIQFVYPNEQRKKLLKELDYQAMEKKAIVNASSNPKNYNWDYSFNGSRSIMPLHVFDDGKFTYLQLRQNQDIPAIFAVSNSQGQEAVVNFRRVGDYIVIQQVAPQFTLRNGKYHVASIFNNKMIEQVS